MSVSDIKVKISALTNGFDEAITKVESSLSKLNKTGQGAGATAAKWGDRFTAAGKALMPASIAAGLLTGATVKLGAEYTKQMGKVQAISGATANEMATLKKVGMEATQGTKFTAIEAGQAYEYMGMAGWKTGQMVAGLKPILNLATAAGADLGTTSDIVTDALTAFGLQAKDTAMFADVLAAASTNSNTNVQMMGETFKYAAPIAGTLGYSVQDTALAIGLMANSGIKASQAGTTLRAALTNMASPSKEAAATMKKLGIHTTDAQGKMLPFRDVIGQLRTGFKGLSKEQQAQAAETLFGKEAMSGMLAIINASDADFNKLAGAIDNSAGASERMAKTMSNADPITTAMAQIKNAMISTAEVVMPFVAKIAEGIAKLAQGFQKLPAPVKGAILGLVAIVAVAAPLLMFIGSLLTGFAALQAIVAPLGIGVMGLVGPFLAVIAVIAAVIAAGIAIYQNWDTIKAKASEVAQGIKSAWNGIKAFFSGLWEGIKSTLSNAWNSIKETATSIWNGISNGIMTIVSPIASFFSDIWNGIKEVLTTVWGGISEVATTIFSALGEFFTTIWSAISEVWSTIWSGISTLLMTVWSGITSIASAIWTPISTFLSAIWDSISSIWSSVWNVISGFLSGIWNGIKSIAQGVFNAIGSIISTAWNLIKSTTTAIWNGIKSILSSVWNGIKSVVQNTWNSIKTIISTAWNIIKSLTSAVWNSIKALLTGNFGAIKSIATSTFNTIKSLISNAWNAVKSNTINTWNAIKSTVTSVLNAIKTTFTNILNAIKSAVTSGMNAVKSAFTNGMNQARSAIAGMVGSFVSVGGNIVRGIARGIIGGIGSVISAAVSAVKRAISAAKAAAGIRSPSRVMAKEVGRWIPAGMAVGITGNLDGVKNAMANLTDVAVNGVGNIGMDSTMRYQIDNQPTDLDEPPKPVEFILNLGNRSFRAFAKDINNLGDRELDLNDFSLV